MTAAIVAAFPLAPARGPRAATVIATRPRAQAKTTGPGMPASPGSAITEPSSDPDEVGAPTRQTNDGAENGKRPVRRHHAATAGFIDHRQPATSNDASSLSRKRREHIPLLDYVLHHVVRLEPTARGWSAHNQPRSSPVRAAGPQCWRAQARAGLDGSPRSARSAQSALVGSTVATSSPPSSSASLAPVARTRGMSRALRTLQGV